MVSDKLYALKHTMSYLTLRVVSTVAARRAEGSFLLRCKATATPMSPTLLTSLRSLLVALPLLGLTIGLPAHAQSITGAPDGTNTRVILNGNRYDIGGGTQSGTNLFQSFQRFGLATNETANFLSSPANSKHCGTSGGR